MDKRYQVFVSSTYRDLQEERREVMQALLEMNCIPAGMELFPASDDDAWTLIKGVIDQSDYYIVVIGGKYGSIDDSGISFTEKEYNYAVKMRKPIAPFLHGASEKLPAEAIELNPQLRKRLEQFRSKVERAHHCKYWTTPEELGGKLARSLIQLIKTKPAVGWIRSDQASPDLLQQLQEARNRIDALEDELEQVKIEIPANVDHLAQGADEVTLGCFLAIDSYSEKTHVGISTTWDELFIVLGPSLDEKLTEEMYKSRLSKGLRRMLDRRGEHPKLQRAAVDVEDFQRVKYQLSNLGLAAQFTNGYQTSWGLTPYGKNYLLTLIAHTKNKKRSD